VSDVSDVLSVTEIRNALRCPRIFALGRLRKEAVAFPVGSSCMGAAFHRLVARFSSTVTAPPPLFAALRRGAPLDDVEASLVRWLTDLLVDELRADPTYATMPGEVDDLAEALRELARHLAARLRAFPGAPAEALARLVRGGERALEASIDGVVVRGTLDALYAQPSGALEVIEYKLTDEANDALDRAQVATYAALLELATGAPAEAVILRFMPMLRETAIGAAEATALVTRDVRPLLGQMARWADAPATAPPTARRDLCAACPVATACGEIYPERVAPRDDPPAGAARPRADARGALTPAIPSAVADAAPDDDDGRREADALRDRILAELRADGVAATSPHPPTVGPTLYEIDVARPRGPVRQLDRAAQDVVHRLASTGTEVTYDPRTGGRRAFVVKRATPRKVLLGPLLVRERAFLGERAGRFVVGERPSGDVLVGDLSDSATPHLLIGGQSGSGKSYLLRALVASLVHYHPPSAIRFLLIDPKRTTFTLPAFASAVGAHLEGPISVDAEEVLPSLERLIETMNERYELFAQEHVSDLSEYNEIAPAERRLERKIVVIDEFQDLAADKASAKQFFDGVKRLSAKARAAGVHLIVATQRPDRETVPPILKTNLGGKIALKVASMVNSRIILDEPGAERLLGKGDLYANLGRGLERAQSAVVG
jgi:DNA segregation ATPase FtsK/SpoIIIE, S-DNA-T family